MRDLRQTVRWMETQAETIGEPSRALMMMELYKMAVNIQSEGPFVKHSFRLNICKYIYLLF